MKVLYLANPLRNGTGGDRRSFEVLRRIGESKIEPIIVVEDSVWAKMKHDGDTVFGSKYKIYRIRRPSVVYDKIFKKTSRAILDYYSILKSSHIIANIAKQEKVDLVVSHHETINFLLEAYFVSLKCSIPWTCIFQLPLLPPYISTSWRKINTARKLYLLTLFAPLYSFVKRAAKTTILLTVSSSIEYELKNFFPSWKSNLKVLRPGVGVNYNEINQVPKSNENFDAIFISRLVPEKGILDLPLIIKEIVKEKSDVRIIVLGRFDSPIIRCNFENLIKELKIEKNIIYKGFVQRKTLYSFLKVAKVFIYPSQFDSFGLVVLESLASGTPVVAYDIPALKLNFPNSFVKRVALRDYKQMAFEALRIINDVSLRNMLSQKAKSFASEFSWDDVFSEEVALYKNFLGKNFYKNH